MADEPSESVAQATQAHECNGAREGSSCSNLSESGAAINDGATENPCIVNGYTATPLAATSPGAAAVAVGPTHRFFK